LEIGQPINSEKHAKAKAEAGYRFYALDAMGRSLESSARATAAGWADSFVASAAAGARYGRLF
jgi:hypothetical protein